MKSIILHDGAELLVDDLDFEWVSKIKWYHANRYAQRQWWVNKVKKSQYLHCMLMSDRDQFVDHIDGNGLNNQTSNLRYCTSSQNMANMNSISRAGFKGVQQIRTGGFASRIRVNGELIYLGFYDTPKKAAVVYDAAAVKYFGKFARTNADMGLL